jgi:hypothetical protein
VVRPVDARICEMQCIVSKQASKERRNEGKKERGRRDVLYVVDVRMGNRTHTRSSGLRTGYCWL